MKNQKQSIKALLPLFMSLFFGGCGGEGGSAPSGVLGESGGGDNDPSENNSPGGAASTVDAAQVTGPCEFELTGNDNSQPILLSNTSSGCDYKVSGAHAFSSDVVIEAGTTFLMGEGASITFENESVEMVGTTDAPIVFQGGEDIAGYWDGIFLDRTTSVLRNVVIRGGGGSSGVSNPSSSTLASRDGHISLENSVVSGSSGTGLYVDGSSATTTIEKFSKNSFFGNAEYGLYLTQLRDASQLDAETDYTGQSIPNGRKAIYISRNDFENNNNFVGGNVNLTDIGVPYLVNGINLSGGLLVQKGVEIQFVDGTEFVLNGGSLHISGTAESPVIITGNPNDSGDWAGINIGNSEASVVMDYFEVHGGGVGQSSSGGSFFIGPPNRQFVSLTNGTFSDSQGWAVLCESGSANSNEDISLVNVAFNSSLAGNVHPECGEINKSPNNNSFDTSTILTTVNDPAIECANLIIGESINQPKVFRNSDAICDYYVVGNNRYLSTTFIEPGTTFIMGKGSKLVIDGNTLTAMGSENARISFFGEKKLKGFWRGISIADSPASSMEFISILGGGSLTGAGLSIKSSSLDLIETEVAGSLGYGIQLSSQGNPTVFNKFLNNSFISNGSVGLSIKASQITEIDKSSIYYSADYPNGFRGVEVSSGAGNDYVSLLREGDVVIRNIGTPWRFPGLTVRSSTNLSFEPGTHIIITDTKAAVVSSDKIQAIGTEELPVTFSGVDSDPSKWGGFYFTGFSDVSFEHVVIDGGGLGEDVPLGLFSSSTNAAITLNSTGPKLAISDSTIKNSHGWGVDCGIARPENIIISNVTFENNTLGDLSEECR